jgi:hypothetical protein
MLGSLPVACERAEMVSEIRAERAPAAPAGDAEEPGARG